MASSTKSGTAGSALLLKVAELRAWLFLIVLIAFFESWARLSGSTSFIFNIYNLQSISVFATAPLLLALGQTFVIISSGIDLSLGFVMGLSSVIAAHTVNYLSVQMGIGPFPAMILGILAGVLITLVPGVYRDAGNVWRGARCGLSFCRGHDCCGGQ